MQGVRLPDNSMPQNPGEYSLITEFTPEQLAAGNKPPHVIGMTPTHHYVRIQTHTIKVEDDGTITISPSILLSDCDEKGQAVKELYHGYLTKGVWTP